MGCANKRQEDPKDKDPDKNANARLSAPPVKDPDGRSSINERLSERNSEYNEKIQDSVSNSQNQNRPKRKFIPEPDMSKIREAAEKAKSINNEKLHSSSSFKNAGSQPNLSFRELPHSNQIKPDRNMSPQSINEQNTELGYEGIINPNMNFDWPANKSPRMPPIYKKTSLDTTVQDKILIKNHKKNHKMEISQTDIELFPVQEESKVYTDQSSPTSKHEIPILFNERLSLISTSTPKYYSEGEHFLKLATPAEMKFWDNLYKSSDEVLKDLKDLIPKYSGTTERNGSTYLILENIYTYSYIKCKIGRVTFTFEMPEDKRNSQAEKNYRTTTGSLGFRITSHPSRDLGAAKESNMHEYFQELAVRNGKLNTALVKKFQKGIIDILVWFTQQRSKMFFGSSVVFTEQGTVKLTGFKHVINAQGEKDDNCIEALESVLKFWEKLLNS